MGEIRYDMAIEGDDPEHIKKFRLIGLPIGILTAALLFLCIFVSEAPNLEAFFEVMVIMGSIFALVYGFETDFGKTPQPRPITGGIISGYLLGVLSFIFINIVRFVMGP